MNADYQEWIAYVSQCEQEERLEAEKIAPEQMAEDWAEFEQWLDEVGHFRELEAA